MKSTLIFVFALVAAVNLCRADDTPIPTITSVSSVYYMVGGTVTMTGASLTLPTNITISGGKRPETFVVNVCTDITLIDASKLTCYFSGLANDKSDPMTVKITFSDTYTQRFPAYFSWKVDQCSQDCKGTCVEGACMCKYDKMSGNNCDITVANGIVPVANVYNGSMKLTDQTQFTVSISSVEEVDKTGKVVTSMDTKTMTWVKDPTSKSWIGTKDSLALSVLTNIFSSSKGTIIFGGQTIDIPNYAMEIYNTLNSWTFASRDNKLQVVYTVTYPANYTINEKMANSTVKSQIIQSRVQSFEVDTAYGTLVGQFPNRYFAGTDKQASIMDVQILDQTAGSLRVAMIFPSFYDGIYMYSPIFVASSKTPKIDPITTSTTGSASSIAIAWSMIIMSIIASLLSL
eukprot:gene15036-17787_t